MKALGTALIVITGLTLTAANETDGLKLPDGFHATVVADGLGPIRHLAVRDSGDVYVSTPKDAQGKGGGIIALRLDASHRAITTEHFGDIDGGTGIRIAGGHLYASAPDGVYRFAFDGNALVPSKAPEAIVEGTPTSHPGFNRTNRPIALDGKGHLFLALDASANLCTSPNVPAGGKPLGLKPCPDLGARAGIWQFDANKPGQKFPGDGVQLATGIRDMTALDWSASDDHLFGIMHGRDGTSRTWPDIVSADDEDHIADEMHRVAKGTNFGWPYTYFDGARNVRLVSPEYGGDGRTSPAQGTYSTPVLTFHSRRSAPVDLLFYSGKQFPASYRGGAFVVLHGTANRTGYDVVFVPFERSGKPGRLTVFADGFANFDPSNPAKRADYRPIGIAQGPDGALYIADSQKGRIWRVAYDGGRQSDTSQKR
ncbi:MAG TPA: PQQ-dependent sugar dehydrogenase [Vicinamibacterales bacterium]|nr:PQQ-dependent sugar dehydrogenase [Vicinamibacterales bacterium]